VHHQARSGSGRSPQSRSTRRRSQEGNTNSCLKFCYSLTDGKV
jgi:hypothetical protein